MPLWLFFPISLFSVQTRPFLLSCDASTSILSSLILSLSVKMYLCPSSPALECESSLLPSAYLSRHLRPGMATRSTTPPPIHVSQSDTAMLRKCVSFSEELLLAASGRTHPINLDLWPWAAVTASSVTTPTPELSPAECHGRFFAYIILTKFLLLFAYTHFWATVEWCCVW